jgi:hypothetical protein
MPTEYQETFGALIRQFFRELFGSRLVERLEEDLMRLRQDFEDRTQEHKIIVASLREEKQMLLSKIATYEAVVMPHASRVGAEVVAYQAPKKPAFNFVDMPREKTRWEQYQDEYYKEESTKDTAEKEVTASA